jgi:ubiquinone/menaquinone biosynthesis C-methylase UbiE
MKLNWAERWVVNNPLRVLMQGAELRWFKKVAKADGFSQVLEIGCGRAAGARLIGRAFNPTRLIATDLDTQMAQKGNLYLSPEEKERVFLSTADVVSLPFRECSMDAAFGFGVLHHVPDWKKGIYEVARVLRMGGLYFLEELYPSLYQNGVTRHFLLHPTENRFRSEELRAGLEEVGFSIRASREVSLVGIMAVCVRETATSK